MPAYFCPKCSHKTIYEAVKPKSCPKCKQNFAAAFATVAKTAPVAPVTTPAKDAVEDDIYDPQETTANTNEGDSYDPREVRRRARQLKASINWQIQVQDSDDKPLKFGDVVQRGDISKSRHG